jgi:acyl-CoA synthetase (AMP-forming)/AMP-acid ligase II
LTHAYGFDNGVLAALASGATLDQRLPRSPRRIAADMAEATIYLGTPAIYRLLAQAPFAAEPDLRAARYLISCTAPIAAEVVLRFAARFGAAPCALYGSSEGGATTLHVPEAVEGRPGSVGRPLPGVRLELAPDTGELVVRGPAVARDYLLGAPDGPSPLQGGSFRSGDLASIDAEGFVTLTGRISTLINVGGLKVSPQEVAESLERHAAVREAAVVGVPSGNGDELVAAAVVLARPVDPDVLVAHCASELAEYKVPRRILVRDALPVGPTGKVRLRAEDVR